MADRIPERIFISYSRKDAEWLARVESQLSPLVHGGHIQPWIDRGEIDYGDQFTREITEGIDTCSAAILLVSPNFQHSGFIRENELPRLLHHADNGEIRLYWILVSDCLLADDLGAYHAVNDSQTPLVEMSPGQVDRVLAQMARNLRQHVQQMKAGVPVEALPGEATFLSPPEPEPLETENSLDMSWKDVECNGVKQGPDHPVVNVSWEDATAFCEWLNRKEGQTYRLPSDHEWSVAVGIGAQEDPNVLPAKKDRKLGEVYPWGTEWPPPENTCNRDGEKRFPFTAPVGSFSLEHHGIKDLSGNVREWCADWFDEDKRRRVLRGGSWDYDFEVSLRSSYRLNFTPTYRRNFIGFRCVLEVGGSGG